ncbi:MAG: heat-inducible transcription repressor HrcA [Nitrospirae bacterium]|nr:heat-inducible transcription repressor HrcA [Nitrospirota bacterium]
MTMSELDERSKKILWATIKSYIDLKSPIGSEVVTKRFSFGLSPATIRNTMADLIELGYLSQPHTSAGRVPTEKGYRLYVDALLKEYTLPLDPTFLQQLFNRLHSIEKNINRLIEETSKTLSAFSHYVGVAIPPQPKEITLKRIGFVKHSDSKVLCVLISEEGIVKNKLITLAEVLTQRDLNKITNYLNHEITGLTLNEIKTKILSQMSREKTICDELIAKALRIFKEAITWLPEYNVYTGEISGTYNLPDFATISQIKKLFKAIEYKHFIAKILDKIAESDGVQVFIGSENTIYEMEDFSIVVSTYKDRYIARGTIGIIGPTGMDYEHVIPLVRHTAETLTEILSEG